MTVRRRTIFSGTHDRSNTRIRRHGNANRTVHATRRNNHASNNNISIIFRVNLRTQALQSRQPRIRQSRIRVRSVTRVPTNKISHTQHTSTSNTRLIGALAHHLAYRDSSIFSRNVITVSNKGTNKARCHTRYIGRRDFSFYSTRIGASSRVIRGIFNRRPSPILRQAFHLMSIYVQLLAAVLAGSPGTALACAARQVAC